MPGRDIKEKRFYLKDKTVILLALAISAGFILRFIYLIQLKATPLFGLFAPDSFYYDKFARALVMGNFTLRESVYLNPLYPFFLAPFYYFFKNPIYQVAFTQIILDCLSCLLIYGISIKVFRARLAGVIASSLYAFYGIAIFYMGFLQDVTLVTFLNLLFFFLILKAFEEKRIWYSVLCGVVFALALLLKAGILISIAILAIWYLLREKALGRGGAGKVFLSIAVGTLLVLTPFASRNYKMEGRFSPLPAQGGLNFYIGNNPEADGSYMHVRGIPDSPVEQAKASVALAEELTGQDMGISEASGYWFERGFRYIAGDPAGYLTLLSRKFLLFLNVGEIDGNMNYYFARLFMPILRLPLLSFGILAPFALLGLWTVLTEREEKAWPVIIMVAAYLISVLIYYVNSRYRMPAVPFMMLLAGRGILHLSDSFREKSKKTAFYLILILAGGFVVSNIDLYGGRMVKSFTTDYTNLGMVYMEKGEIHKALRAFEKAVSINPSYAEAYYSRGLAYDNMDMHEEALFDYRKAERLGLISDELHYNIGLLYFKLGKTKEALREYGKAIGINPRNKKAYNNIGTIYYQSGLLEEAVDSFKRAIDADPRFVDALYNLGNTYFRMERYSEATELYKRTIEVKDFADARYNLGVSYYRSGRLDLARRHLKIAEERGIKPDYLIKEALGL